MLDVKTEQRVLGPFHGRGLVMLVLTQKQEVLPELIFSEGGRVALEMLGKFSDIPDILFLCRLTEIFKLDVFLELSDRRIRSVFHRSGRVHLSEGNFPANLQTMHGDLFSFCRAAAQFNQSAAANSRRAFRATVAGNSEARRALHRRSPAAVAELGR